MNHLLSHDCPQAVTAHPRDRSRTLVPVLVTVPDLQMPGGVSHYYTVLKHHLAEEAEYFTVGARAAHRKRDATVVRLLRDYWHFYRRLRRHEPGLVHLNPSLGYKALLRDGVFLLLAKLRRRKVIVFIRGWNSACEHAIRHRYPFLFRSVYLRADAFVVLSSRFQSCLRDLGYAGPVYIETTVVPDEVLRHEEGTNKPVGAENHHLNILFLSRIERAKGIYEAVDAFRSLRARCPWATLTIAGAGSELAAVQAYVGAKKIEGIQFVGWLTGPEKHRAFAQADIYLFPTWWGEGMPNSVVEAMGHGLPVVTRPVGGLVDFFEQGTMGFMTDSRDPEVFASLLEKLVRDPGLRQTIGQYNRSFAQKNFAASVAAERLRKIYREVSADEGDHPGVGD